MNKWLRCGFLLLVYIGSWVDLPAAVNRYPQSMTVLEKDGYTVGYDGRCKVPAWVYERLTKEGLKGSASRDGLRFQADPDVYALHQSEDDDYLRSGFSRGHMAPAADHKRSDATMRGTFVCSNACPQIQEFNGKYWSKLEAHARKLTKDYDVIEVISGPLFLPEDYDDGNRYVSYQVIGENDVSVPTHFFKVIYAWEGAEVTRTWAYLIPHEDISYSTKLSRYEEPIAKIERVSGLIFPK